MNLEFLLMKIPMKLLQVKFSLELVQVEDHIQEKVSRGRRAKIIYFKEEENKIIATHDGYKRIGAIHTRCYSKLEQKVIIEDIIESNKLHKIESFLHFHPDCNINFEENKITVDSHITILFNSHSNLVCEEYDFPLGYNRTKKAYKIRTSAETKSKIEISYEN